MKFVKLIKLRKFMSILIVDYGNFIVMTKISMEKQ